MTPEKALWRAVIAAAVKDSRNRRSDGHHEAVHWLTAEDNKDRGLVCELADLDEERLKIWARGRYWASI